MLAKIPKQFYYFLAAYFILNLIQSALTELIFDEAYYWYYSQKLAWGYFDHPPMVAFLIKLSSFFFNGELGVRFLSCVISAANLIVLWLLIDNPKKKNHIPHFFLLVFSMTLLNAYGFFTLPDTPLLFFTSCFLLTYKYFLKTPRLTSGILLGVCMAALMYSKYHAVLVIVFVLFSNLSLVKNRYAWLSVGVALLCYSPHFYWLFENDFVSIKYHLYERPNDAYNFEKYTLGFFVNLIAIFGLTFPFIYYALLKTKGKDLFNRALLFLTYGVILFFFISSFNRRVQTQWIIVICIPLAILVFNYMLTNKGTMKWIVRLGIVNAVLILYLRAGLIYQPLLFNFYYESHGNKEWVNGIKDEVGEIPVVFENSYRNAPMYEFYTGGIPTFSLNNVMYRKNQYSIDSSEERVRGKKVAYLSKYINDNSFSYTKSDGWTYKGKYIGDFNSFRKLECLLEEDNIKLGTSGYNLKVVNPYDFNIELSKLKFSVAYLTPYKNTIGLKSVKPSPAKEGIAFLPKNDTVNFTLDIPPFKKQKVGYVRIVISENGLYPGLNGKPIPVE
ncbi:glycosyltransferase family 39 protein [Maribacter sp. PR1]|uniref:Glycosyltransferase family 39 protein n=1 Tax=Maribacter cobaltidurans TaxID=1178778 RepID=A0ABU7IRK3_9FLAO|nr:MULTISPECIES: glycosyltransferase family 39 protein [Maribacter]MDC6388205.1 glycosyltransferase family 39 protein [Maribacter sp. PR1]MEE1975593.1 glycosyltransferase family 39 protein [Maribacter cobaltidurans]